MKQCGKTQQKNEILKTSTAENIQINLSFHLFNSGTNILPITLTISIYFNIVKLNFCWEGTSQVAWDLRITFAKLKRAKLVNGIEKDHILDWQIRGRLWNFKLPETFWLLACKPTNIF